MIVSFVNSLLKRCCPLAILFGVAKAVVNSVNGVIFGWCNSHIGNKVNKALFPAIAHSYSSTTVNIVAGSVRVVAPLDHHLPNREFMGSGHSVLGNSLSVKASTGCSHSVPEGLPHNGLGVSAFTNNVPINIARFVRTFGHSCEPSKFSTGQINEFWHNNLWSGA